MYMIALMSATSGSDMTSGVTGLQDKKRQATVDHLVQAALAGMVERGLDVTVEEVARIAGVSRRTVFHHFATRDDLLAAAALAAQAQFDQSLPVYAGDGDWRTWLSELCRAVHSAKAADSRGLWEMLIRQDLSARLAATAEQIALHRRERYQALAQTLWQALDNHDAAPDDFRASVIAHLSGFFTIAAKHDACADPALAASVAEAAILDMVNKYSPQR